MRLQLGFEATARMRASSVPAVWLPLAYTFGWPVRAALALNTRPLHGTAFLEIDGRTDALSMHQNGDGSLFATRLVRGAVTIPAQHG